MELGKRTTTTQGYKNWGYEVIYSESDLATIQEAQSLDGEEAKSGALVAFGANARRDNPALVEANRDDFARGLYLAASHENGISNTDDAYYIAKGVRAMDSILTLVRWHPAVRNVILEALSSPDNEREETE